MPGRNAAARQAASAEFLEGFLLGLKTADFRPALAYPFPRALALERRSHLPQLLFFQPPAELLGRHLAANERHDREDNKHNGPAGGDRWIRKPKKRRNK